MAMLQRSITLARDIPVPQDSQVVPTLIFGYEYAMTGSTNLNVQAYISESVYTRRQTELDELLGEKYQLSFGVAASVE